MKQLLNWMNSYPDGAKAWVMGFVMMTLCYVLLGIGLLVDGNGIGKFLAHDNAGTGGQVIFGLFAVLYLVCLFITLFGKRAK